MNHVCTYIYIYNCLLVIYLYLQVFCLYNYIITAYIQVLCFVRCPLLRVLWQYKLCQVVRLSASSVYPLEGGWWCVILHSLCLCALWNSYNDYYGLYEMRLFVQFYSSSHPASYTLFFSSNISHYFYVHINYAFTIVEYCPPTIYRPAPVMTWLKDGTQVSSSGRVTISANGWSITLIDVRSTDSGEYTCRAVQTSNTGPITATSSGSLIVVGECGMQLGQSECCVGVIRN